jgi:polyhydroxybutyrate depolymerase
MRLAAALAFLCACSKPAPLQAGGRPYEVKVGPKHDAKQPAPVLFLLHAYATPPARQETYFRFTEKLEQRGWILVVPSGTVDQLGNHFWNATEACCDRFGKKPDELAYLDRVWDDVSSRYAIDPHAVFALGMSNGGFLAHRLACERSERFTAVASIVGAGFIDPARCQPKAHVAVLQVHGDADELVLYDGGTNLLGSPLLGPYPDARTPLVRWAEHNGCVPLGGDQWGNCDAPVELWTVRGGKHYLPPSPVTIDEVLRFFERAKSRR